MPTKLKKLTDVEIKKMLQQGIKDFSDIVAPLSDFSGMDLSGVSFKNSDLKYTSFLRTNLQNANLSNTDLKWSELEFADVRNAKFVKADISWSNLNNMKVDKTDFTKAKLNWSTIFNVDLGKCIIEGTRFSDVAFAESEITKDGLKIALDAVEGLPIPQQYIDEIKQKMLSKNPEITPKVADKAFEMASELSRDLYNIRGVDSLHTYMEGSSIDVYASREHGVTLYIRQMGIDDYNSRRKDYSIDSYLGKSEGTYSRRRGGYTER